MLQSFRSLLIFRLLEPGGGKLKLKWTVYVWADRGSLRAADLLASQTEASWIAMASLSTLMASEASLLQEAALALPHSFDKCTHSKGPIRQAIHLCLTCAVPRGLCSACSVACHGDHGEAIGPVMLGLCG